MEKVNIIRNSIRVNIKPFHIQFLNGFKKLKSILENTALKMKIKVYLSNIVMKINKPLTFLKNFNHRNIKNYYNTIKSQFELCNQNNSNIPSLECISLISGKGKENRTSINSQTITTVKTTTQQANQKKNCKNFQVKNIKIQISKKESILNIEKIKLNGLKEKLDQIYQLENIPSMTN